MSDMKTLLQLVTKFMLVILVGQTGFTGSTLRSGRTEPKASGDATVTLHNCFLGPKTLSQVIVAKKLSKLSKKRSIYFRQQIRLANFFLCLYIWQLSWSGTTQNVCHSPVLNSCLVSSGSNQLFKKGNCTWLKFLATRPDFSPSHVRP